MNAFLESQAMKPEAQWRPELGQRMVEAVHPLPIILCGSAARGASGPDRDLEVLVVLPDGVHRRETGQVLSRHLFALGFATASVVGPQSEIEWYASNPSLLRNRALHEGKALYPTPTRKGP